MMTCSICGAKLPCAPTLTTPITCGCGVTYSASVDLAILHRRHRELEADVAALRKTAQALSSALMGIGKDPAE